MSSPPAGRPGPPSRPGRGLVLVRGSAAASARWLRKGLVTVSTHELDGWTGVTLAEDHARSAPPYDKGLEVLAARPVPARRRPAVGLFEIDGCAVVTIQARGWRAEQRWLVWQPGLGLRRTPELPALPASLLIATAGARGAVTPPDLAALFSTTVGEPVDLLVALVERLGLPGGHLLTRPVGGSRVEPTTAAVRRFDSFVSDEQGSDS